MAQLNITLDQDEILKVLADSSGDAFRELLAKGVDAILKAESAEQLGASPYERTDQRTGHRNGTRQRPLTTRIGTIDLTVPRHREVPFETMVFENYARCEASLVTTMAEMVVAGVSTAKVSAVMKEICGKTFSKQSVSQACKELDEAVEEFRGRPLGMPVPFVILDATYIKVREGCRVKPKAFLIAIGIDSKGMKEVLGFDVADSENEECWRQFLSSLAARGLHGVRMITTDACEGLVSAVMDTFPGAAWQRCQAHFSRNICDAAPKGMKAGLRSELSEMFACKTIEEATARRDEIASDYAESAPKAIRCLLDGFDDSMTAMTLPPQMRICTRTSNLIERLNREVKRRTKVIGIFPNGASAVRLIGSVLMDCHDRWQTKRETFYKPSYERLEADAEVLAGIAKSQAMMRKAI